jgi:hypothetical protein
VPPKLTLPFVAETKSGIALEPVSASVGKVKFHHLKPSIWVPLESTPFGVPLERVVQRDGIVVGRRPEVPCIHEPGSVGGGDPTVVLGDLDVDGLGYERDRRDVSHA